MFVRVIVIVGLLLANLSLTLLSSMRLSCDVLFSLPFVCQFLIVLCRRVLFVGALRLDTAWFSVAVSQSDRTMGSSHHCGIPLLSLLLWLGCPCANACLILVLLCVIKSVRLIFARCISVRLVLGLCLSILGVLVLLAPHCVCLYLVGIWIIFRCLFGVGVPQGWVFIHLSCSVSSCAVCRVLAWCPLLGSVWAQIGSRFQSPFVLPLLCLRRDWGSRCVTSSPISSSFFEMCWGLSGCAFKVYWVVL